MKRYRKKNRMTAASSFVLILVVIGITMIASSTLFANKDWSPEETFDISFMALLGGTIFLVFAFMIQIMRRKIDFGQNRRYIQPQKNRI